MSTSVCLNPPPAATLKMMPANGGSDFSSGDASSARFIPEPRPKVAMATRTASSSATSGVPRKSSAESNELPWPAKMSASALPSISTTGSRTVNSVVENFGRRRAGPVLPAAAVSVCEPPDNGDHPEAVVPADATDMAGELVAATTGAMVARSTGGPAGPSGLRNGRRRDQQGRRSGWRRGHQARW